MKIYCILFDTCPQYKKIEDLFLSKNLHYSDYITNSWTATTLISMFSGRTPSEMKKYGIGYEKPYINMTDNEKIDWNEKIIFNELPSDWKIHIHSMPETRGDEKNFRFVPDELFDVNFKHNYYNYKTHNVVEFLKQMHRHLLKKCRNYQVMKITLYF